jgi:NAD-dependent SIR2 family protein deacetylase
MCENCVPAHGKAIRVEVKDGLYHCQDCKEPVLKSPWRDVRYQPPNCPKCGMPLRRWSWHDFYTDPLTYWYCLQCDLAGVEPCIFTFTKASLTQRT